MALKAYKHLTDGEVKIVEEDSAEEAGLLADVVHGASYVQLQTDGTREEVASAQGTALWTDVTADLGGGGSAFEHLTEDTDNSILVADWPYTIGDWVNQLAPFAALAAGGLTMGDQNYSLALNIEFGLSLGTPGSGVLLKSPDGLTTKMVTIDNAGEIALL